MTISTFYHKMALLPKKSTNPNLLSPEMLPPMCKWYENTKYLLNSLNIAFFHLICHISFNVRENNEVFNENHPDKA